MTTLKVDLLPHQVAFLKAQEREVLYSGAWRAGKTRALCYKLLTHARVPGAFVGLCRKTQKSLSASTLRTLLEPDPPYGPVLPEGEYTRNRNLSRIFIKGGGQIYYFGFDEPIRMGSYGFDAIGVDEGIELTAEEYRWLLSRISGQATGCRQVFTATNPGPKTHVLYERFFGTNFDLRAKDAAVFQAKTTDNIFLPPDYIESLESLPEQMYRRYVLGEWGNFEGMIYSNWDREIHLSTETPAGVAYAGVDDGFTNPFAVVVGILTPEEDLHIVAEHYESGLVQDEKVDICKELFERFNIEMFYADPSAAGLIQALRNADMAARGCSHRSSTSGLRAQLEGIGKVQRRMAINPKLGRARYTVDPACVNLIRETEGYHMKPGTDTPHKEHDHTPDALRYLVASIDRGGLMDWEEPPLRAAREGKEVARLPRYRDHGEEVETVPLTLGRDKGAEWFDSDD